jgi:nucleoside-diphosphate-sugar epimerase
MREPQKMNSTIRFERHQGHYALYHYEDMASAHICVGFQPAKQAVVLAGGRIAYTVEEIADILGVTRPTVKKYMWELREGDLLAQQELQILEPDRNIFWTERRPGGAVLGIKANIIWD